MLTAMLAPALVALSLSASGCGLPPLAPGPLPFAAGETLRYDLDLLGMVRAGSLELSVERTTPGGREIPLRARARTDASVENLLRLTAVAFSWVDARTVIPERYREEAEENGVHKVSDFRLSPAGATIDVDYDMGGAHSQGHFPRQGAVLDALSALYLLRAAKLAPGESFCFDLVARGKVWRVQGSAAPKFEKLTTVLGPIETFRLDAKATLENRPQDPVREMHAWFSNDARRLFLVAVGDVDLGPVRLTLAEARTPRR